MCASVSRPGVGDKVSEMEKSDGEEERGRRSGIELSKSAGAFRSKSNVSDSPTPIEIRTEESICLTVYSL